MTRKLFVTAIFSALACAMPAHAAVIASSDFATGDEGWTIGEFTGIGPNLTPTYDPIGQLISTGDVAANVAFIASSAYLGDQSGAFGGSISFDLSDASNDGTNYSPLSLTGAGITLYARPTPPPSTTALSAFNISLVGASFVTSDPFGTSGATATDAQLLAVLADLDQLAILADWQSGGDFSQLDNVVLSDGATAVPEPAAWALMIGGFGLAGTALRRARPKLAFAG
ncbi:PEPxxWA-CTERM sorting domain-containing protein [Sphingomonas sp. 1P06PA]|uniref:PEPxxWA-CTERM sorting domain-containing protein n=1 Tax=Sphingomonas sp. 1P06PA TaxID=554121 RepID=UPI0039A40CC0